MIRFFLALLSASLLSGVVTFYGAEYLDLEVPSFLWPTLALLFFATLVIYGYLMAAIKPGYFVQIYLMTMAVKVLGYGVYNYFIIVKDKDGALANVLFFMVVYFLFTGLEIAFLYPKISGQPRK